MNNSPTGLYIGIGISVVVAIILAVLLLGAMNFGWFRDNLTGEVCTVDETDPTQNSCTEGLDCSPDPSNPDGPNICTAPTTADCPECAEPSAEPSAESCGDFCECPEGTAEVNAETCAAAGFGIDFSCPEGTAEVNAETCAAAGFGATAETCAAGNFCPSCNSASAESCASFCPEAADAIVCPPGFTRNYNYGVNVAAKCDKDTQRCERCIGINVPEPTDWPHTISRFSGGRQVTDPK